MAPTMVTVGGTETQQRTPDGPEPRLWGVLLVVVGLAAGLLLGAIFTGTGTQPDGVTDTVVGDPSASPTTAPLTTTTTEVVVPRLGTMVPGMLDTLIVTAIDRSGMQVVSVWEPAGRAPANQPLPWGDIRADATRLWLAGGTANRWTGSRVLWVGNRAYMEPVSSALVGDPVWHTRLAGHLAWVESDGDRRLLTTGAFTPGSPTIPRPVREVSATTEVAGWGDAGLLTVTWDDDGYRATLDLVRESGVVEPGIEVSSPPAVGQFLIAVPSPSGGVVLLDWTLQTVAAAPWSRDCWDARWGPNGLTALVRCGFGADQRVEYWLDALETSEPAFTLASADISAFGFTTDGLPYIAEVDPIRPTTTITFYRSIGDQVHEVSHPGRAIWIETVRS